MSTQKRILIGVAVGTALAGVGFMLFHPSGRKIRKKAMDIGLDAADKLIDYIRTTIPDPESEAGSPVRRSKAAEAVHEM